MRPASVACVIARVCNNAIYNRYTARKDENRVGVKERGKGNHATARSSVLCPA